MDVTPAQKALLLQIERAFRDLGYPGEDHIVLADGDGIHAEGQRIRAALRGLHWRDVPFETLRSLRSALAFLTPVGYRFYIPAFLLFSVADFREADVLPDEVIQSLTLPQEVDLERLRDFRRGNSDAQPLSPEEWEQIITAQADLYRGGTPQRLFVERVSGFDPAQRAAIHNFLEYMRDVHGEEFPNQEPDTALRRYWASV